MGKLRFYWLGTFVVVSLIAWDDWQLREELGQLRQERTAQIAAIPIPAQTVAPVLPNTGQPKDCPVNTPNVSAKATTPPTPPKADSAAGQSTEVVAIPPGTSLPDAIKIIQREQAKTNPGSAAMNPFGSAK